MQADERTIRARINYLHEVLSEALEIEIALGEDPVEEQTADSPGKPAHNGILGEVEFGLITLVTKAEAVTRSLNGIADRL